MTAFRNLTPHPISVLTELGERRTFQPDPAGPARVSTHAGRDLATVDGIVIRARPGYGAIEGLPVPQDGTILIVSALVLEHALAREPDRNDVVAPDTGPDAVREGGQVVAVRRLLGKAMRVLIA